MEAFKAQLANFQGGIVLGIEPNTQILPETYFTGEWNNARVPNTTRVYEEMNEPTKRLFEVWEPFFYPEPGSPYVDDDTSALIKPNGLNSKYSEFWDRCVEENSMLRGKSAKKALRKKKPKQKPRVVTRLTPPPQGEDGGGGGSKERSDSDVQIVSEPSSLSEVTKLIRKNVPLKFSNNSCYLDTQMVPLLFDRTSPYFNKLLHGIYLLFRELGLDLYKLDGTKTRITLMDPKIIKYLNETYSQLDMHQGDMGTIGDFQNALSNNALAAYTIGSDMDIENFMCIRGPFAIKQYEANSPEQTAQLASIGAELPEQPSVDAILNFALDFEGKRIAYKVHAISGLKRAHWQTLVNLNDNFYLVNVTGNGPQVQEMSLQNFVNQFTQLRVYYVTDQMPEHTEPQIDACDLKFKELISERLGLGDGWEEATLEQLWEKHKDELTKDQSVLASQISQYLVNL